MSRTQRNGFTVTELLVVIAIIAVLIAIFMPATRRVREASTRIQCLNNLKQIILAVHSYESVGRPAPNPSPGSPASSSGRLLPPGCFGPGTTPEERLSWMVAILPYVESNPLYMKFDMDKGYAGNLPAAQTQFLVYLCPELRELKANDALTSYVAMSGIGYDAACRPAGAAGNGFMGYDRLTTMAMIKDGASNTIALMETHKAGPWARGGTSTLRGFDPADLPWHGDNRPFGGHAFGMNVAFADGSARFLRSSSVDAKMLADAITIAGGETVDLEWASP